MDWERILELTLDVGVELIRSGGETHRVVDTLYRIAGSYGYQDINFWVVPSNIQTTVTAPDGRKLTQIRNIRGSGLDFDRLALLNELSRWACAEQPDAQELSQRFEEIKNSPPQRVWLQYLAITLGGWGFSLFFGCNLLDSLVALLASLMVAFLIRRLSRHEANPLILNFFISFFIEAFIIVAVHFGFGNHLGTITIGVVMLLISGLGATNGLRDLVHLDTLSGVMNITASFTGAIGIALGIALPMFIFRSWVAGEAASPDPNVWIQLVSGTIACVGFAVWFHVMGRKILFCAIGVFLTTGMYLLIYHLVPDEFTATLIAAVVCGLYSQISARIIKTPATIFSTICILTLIPGSSLYYTMYGIVTKNMDYAYEKSMSLLLICFGIVLGYMAVEVANRFIWRRHYAVLPNPSGNNRREQTEPTRKENHHV